MWPFRQLNGDRFHVNLHSRNRKRSNYRLLRIISGSTALGTDDAVITDEFLPHGSLCLATGNRPEINDIVPEIAEQFIQLSKVDEGSIAGALRRALRIYRKAQIDEIFGGFGDINGSLDRKGFQPVS